jgi:hypothetical protein
VRAHQAALQGVKGLFRAAKKTGDVAVQILLGAE